MNIVFEPIKHQYSVDGKRVPGVSEVMSTVLDNLGDEEPESKEPSSAQIKGTIIHKTLELLDKDNLKEYDPRLKDYVDAWNSFKEQRKPEFLGIEMIGYNPVGLCGTIDRVCKINGSLWILDIKSGKSYKGYPLQTAGYKLLIQPNYKEDIRRACIYFDKNNYVFVEHDDIQDEITFRAILQVYKWKKNKL